MATVKHGHFYRVCLINFQKTWKMSSQSNSACYISVNCRLLEDFTQLHLTAKIIVLLSSTWKSYVRKFIQITVRSHYCRRSVVSHMLLMFHLICSSSDHNIHLPPPICTKRVHPAVPGEVFNYFSLFVCPFRNIFMFTWQKKISV